MKAAPLAYCLYNGSTWDRARLCQAAYGEWLAKQSPFWMVDAAAPWKGYS